MNIIEIIEKKRDNKELTKQEIEFFIKGLSSRKFDNGNFFKFNDKT